MAQELHPAENRGLRELYLTARQLADHWTALARRRPGSPIADVLGRGAQAARNLLEEHKHVVDARLLPVSDLHQRGADTDERLMVLLHDHPEFPFLPGGTQAQVFGVESREVVAVAFSCGAV